MKINFEEMTWAEILDLQEKYNMGKGGEERYHPCFTGIDHGYYYVILEDREAEDEIGEIRYIYLYFTDGESVPPYEAFGFDNLAEAMATLAARFLLDNVEEADSVHSDIEKRHEKVLRSIMDLTHFTYG